MLDQRQLEESQQNDVQLEKYEAVVIEQHQASG
jgi:hypothetical protein